MKPHIGELEYTEVTDQRPHENDDILDSLLLLLSTTPRGAVVWETRNHKGRIRHFLGSHPTYLKKIKAVFSTYLNVQFSEITQTDRPSVVLAKKLEVSNHALSLKTDDPLSVIRAAFSVLAQVRGNEQAVVQILFGPSYEASSLPQKIADPNASLFRVITGNTGQASPETRTLIKEKIGEPGFSVVIRIGASGTETTAPSYIYNLLSAFKTIESAGNIITAVPENPAHLDSAHVPNKFKLKLSHRELSPFMLIAVGDSELPGVDSLHPKIILTPEWIRDKNERRFAVGTDGKNLSISPKDALEHLVSLGSTGGGKSTLFLNLALADIRAGRGVLVIDPKNDLVNDLLARIPPEREDDVVVIDPTSETGFTTGFNPLAFQTGHNPYLIADSLLEIFKNEFRENWGIRSQDHISSGLLTLSQIPGASLLWLPALFTNEVFRRRIVAQINDRVSLLPYWEAFESMSNSEKKQEIAPLINKPRQFLLRPGLRNILGQSKPKFDLNSLFEENKIVLLGLNKGVIGSESARLLGSMAVGVMWVLALSRARLPAEKRNIVSIYIDELQDYISSISADFSDSLAQARGLGVSFNVAHQYRAQLPPEVASGIDANARNKVCFNISAADAKSMAAMAPELTAEDFMSLKRFEIYTSFQQNGRNTGWLSGKTLPPPPPIRDPEELKAKSMERYGKSGTEVEEEYLSMLAEAENQYGEIDIEEPPAEIIGRRKRT